MTISEQLVSRIETSLPMASPSMVSWLLPSHAIAAEFFVSTISMEGASAARMAEIEKTMRMDMTINFMVASQNLKGAVRLCDMICSILPPGLTPRPGMQSFRLRLWHMRIVSILFGIAFATTALSAAEEREVDSKVIKRIHSQDGKVILELRGSRLKDSTPLATQAWVVSGGRQTFVSQPETYIRGADISADGQYIALDYHVSSGGYGAAFVRLANGTYRQFVDNGYAAGEIAHGRVAGLRKADIPETPGRNTYLGIYMGHAPDRLVFSIGNQLKLTYSFEARRITGWERSLLEYSQTSGDGEFQMDLRELSGKRGIALVAYSSQKTTEREQTLIVFPAQKIDLHDDGFKMRTEVGSEGVVAFTAKRVTQGSKDEPASWRAEITGTGMPYKSLLAKLASYRKSLSLSADATPDWPAAGKFSLSQVQ